MITESNKTEEEILTDDIPDHLHPNVKKYWLTTNMTGVMLFLLFFLFPFIMIALLYGGIELFAVLFLILAIIITVAASIAIILINKTYDNITFLVRSESLIINRGILFKQSQTIPFNRVQNVDIYRGPLERMFGIATIFIQTAGWGGNILRGRLQGISNPKLLRDIILKRVVTAKNNGI
ncbi:MAG: PH domain-containing protein [Thermoplasmata archaeon]|nr:MAG: PH domain-containing protein [Thermoplasmata archaeon]